MADVLKIQGVEQTINATANTISGGSNVRVLNKDSGYVLVTVQNVVANVANTSITLAPGASAFIRKSPTDTLTSNATANCVGAAVKFF